MAEANVLRLLSEFVHAIRFHGPEKTSDILYNSRASLLNLDDQHIVEVLRVVSAHVGIPVSEIISGTGRKNNRCFALGLAGWYLKYEFKLLPADISRSLNRDRTAIWKYVKDIHKLNPTRKVDKLMCDIKIRCDIDIAAYKKSNSVF